MQDKHLAWPGSRSGEVCPSPVASAMAQHPHGSRGRLAALARQRVAHVDRSVRRLSARARLLAHG